MIVCRSMLIIKQISRVLQIIAFYDFVYLHFHRFPPILFVRHENGGSRQDLEFTTCVSKFNVCLGRNWSRDYGEHEFTIPMERSIIALSCSQWVILLIRKHRDSSISKYT